MVGDFEILIAAAAIESKRALVTENTRHFERIGGLQVEGYQSEKASYNPLVIPCAMRYLAPTAMPAAPIHVLLVEDEPSIRDNILIALEAEAMRVSAAGTGGEAEAVLDAGGVDLVLLDVGLPDANGLDLCREWRARHPKLPVVFLTARGSEVDKVVGLEIGGDDYLVKPISLRELVARIRAVLRRSGRHSGNAAATLPYPASSLQHTPAASACRLIVDEARMRILADGQPLDLARTEFRLLRVFIQHPERVFSRAQLMDMAWEDPDAALERTVDAHVKQLRAKLRSALGGIDPIQTHRGLGYSYSEPA